MPKKKNKIMKGDNKEQHIPQLQDDKENYEKLFSIFYDRGGKDVIGNVVTKFLSSKEILKFSKLNKILYGDLKDLAKIKRKSEIIKETIEHFIDISKKKCERKKINDLVKSVNLCYEDDEMLVDKLELELLTNINRIIAPISASDFSLLTESDQEILEQIKIIPYNLRTKFLWCGGNDRLYFIASDNSYVYCQENVNLKVILVPNAQIIHCRNCYNLQIIVSDMSRIEVKDVFDRDNIIALTTMKFRRVMKEMMKQQQDQNHVHSFNDEADKEERIKLEKALSVLIEAKKSKLFSNYDLEILDKRSLNARILAILEESATGNSDKINIKSGLQNEFLELTKQSKNKGQYQMLEAQIKNHRILNSILKEDDKIIALDDVIDEWKNEWKKTIEPYSASQIDKIQNKHINRGGKDDY